MGYALAEVAERLGGPRWSGWLKHGGWLRPRLFDLQERSEVMTFEPARLLTSIAGLPEGQVESFLLEARAVTSSLANRTKDPALPFPQEWAASPATGELLYALARASGPERVVETGVANGVSSTYLLEALEKNGRGRLDSYDTSPRAGGLVTERLRPRWSLHVLSSDRPGTDLARALDGTPSVDFAFLDADHSYRGQTLEYRLVTSRMRTGGWLVSDDVDWSYAFLDLSGRLGVRPSFLVTESKVVGVLRPRE